MLTAVRYTDLKYSVPDRGSEIETTSQTFVPKNPETFAPVGDESENRAVGNQVHNRQDQKRFQNSRLLKIGLAKARFAPVRNEMKRGRPAENGEKGFRIQIDKIRED